MTVPTTEAELAAYLERQGLRPVPGSEPCLTEVVRQREYRVLEPTGEVVEVMPTVLHEARSTNPYWPYRSRTEQRYALLLEQWQHDEMLVRWRYEALRLTLAPRTTLTVDFYLIFPEGVGDGRPQLHETKGWIREDSWIKLKQAAALYPEFRFFMVRRHKEHWEWKEVPSA
jgi:hypothetical protein